MYSRQIGTYGKKTMDSIQTLRVRVENVTPITAEILKNLILSGIGTISIYESVSELPYTTIVGQSMSEVMDYCHSLNPLVKCTWKKEYTSIFTEEDSFDVLIADLCRPPQGDETVWKAYDEFCILKNKWVLLIGCRYVMEDHYPAYYIWQNTNVPVHHIHDVTGENPKQYLCCSMVYVEEEQKTALTIRLDNDLFDFEENDLLEMYHVSLPCQYGIVRDICRLSQTIVLDLVIEGGSKSYHPMDIEKNGYYVRKCPVLSESHQLQFDSWNVIHHRIGEDIPFFLVVSKDTEYVYDYYPHVSMVGAWVSQECIKSTGKYLPCIGLTQFYYPVQRRMVEPLDQKNILIVGMGALGCEALKNLAMMTKTRMDTPCTRGTRVFITDMDQIQLTNLSRQYLFQPEDIGKWKTEVAKCKIMKWNSHLQVESFISPIHDHTLFDDAFWSSLDMVINAVDNLEARRYVDDQCRWYKIPLFESGTLGTKCNFQYIIPDETETYNDSNDVLEEEESSIPVCTIKSFPYKIEHCIQWAKEILLYLITEFPYKLQQHEYSKDSDEDGHPSLESKIWKHLNETDSLVPRLHRISLVITEYYFLDEIRHIQAKHPLDSTDDQGTPFWTSPRTYPTLFSINDPFLMDIANETFCLLEQCFQACETSRSGLTSRGVVLWDKDNDDNHQMRWIQKASNVRAITYSIPAISFFECKHIAGQIIPAVCTTTSFIMGRVCQSIFYPLYKKNAFYNLALNIWIESDVLPPKKIQSHYNLLLSCSMEVINIREEESTPAWTCWDRVFLNHIQFKTLYELKTYLETKYRVSVTSIMTRHVMLYNEFMTREQEEQALIYDISTQKRLQIEGLTENGSIALFPLFQLGP